jgi:hypothetical protein
MFNSRPRMIITTQKRCPSSHPSLTPVAKMLEKRMGATARMAVLTVSAIPFTVAKT